MILYAINRNIKNIIFLSLNMYLFNKHLSMPACIPGPVPGPEDRARSEELLDSRSQIFTNNSSQ